MAITPSHEDPNRKEALKDIEKIKKDSNTDAADTLKARYNMGEKQRTVVLTESAAQKLTSQK